MGYINKDLILSGLNFRLIRLKSEHESEEKITELENIIGAIEETETDDVIERSEYEKLRLVNLDFAETNKGLLAEHEQLLKLRSKIDKAIEEMNSIYEGLVMDCSEMRDYCVEILKRNIGE